MNYNKLMDAVQYLGGENGVGKLEAIIQGEMTHQKLNDFSAWLLNNYTYSGQSLQAINYLNIALIQLYELHTILTDATQPITS